MGSEAPNNKVLLHRPVPNSVTLQYQLEGLPADRAPAKLRPYIEAGFSAIEIDASKDQWGNYTATYDMQKDGKDAGRLTICWGPNDE